MSEDYIIRAQIRHVPNWAIPMQANI